MFWPKQDQVIGRALMDYGEFAEGENIIMARYLRAGDVAVDVGANVGTTTLAMARQVGPGGQVIALEPQPAVAHCLAAALAVNGLAQVRLLTVAAGQHSGMVKMDFSQPLRNYGTAKIVSQGDARTTISRLCPTLSFEANPWPALRRRWDYCCSRATGFTGLSRSFSALTTFATGLKTPFRTWAT